MVVEEDFVREAFDLLDETIKERSEVLDTLIKNGHIDIAGLIAIRSTQNLFGILDMVYRNRISVDQQEFILDEKDVRALHLFAYHLETLSFDIAMTKKAIRELLQSVKPVKDDVVDPLAVDSEQL